MSPGSKARKEDAVDPKHADMQNTLKVVNQDLEHRREKIEEGLRRTRSLLDATNNESWVHRRKEFDSFIDRGLVNLTGDESFKSYRISREGNLLRRIFHCIAATSVVCYFFPSTLFTIPIPMVMVIALAIIPITMDTIRIVGEYEWKSIREHEKNQYASYVWFCLGSLLLILLTPQVIAAPVIIAAAFGDPLIGETRRFRRSISFGIGFLFCFLVFFLLFDYDLLLAVAAGLVTFFAEATNIQFSWGFRKDVFYSRSRGTESWLSRFSRIKLHSDDDFLMQVIPGAILFVIWAFHPEWFPDPVLPHLGFLDILA